MGDSIDAELFALINKLNKIQKDVGGKSKGGANDGIVSTEQGGKIDRFMDLKNQMVDRLKVMRETFETIQRLEKAPGTNPKELIAAQSSVRADLTALNEDWRLLDSIFRNEGRKRKSKFSAEELAYRQRLLVELQEEINNLKEIQRSGYVQSYQMKKLERMEDSELFKSRFNPSEAEATGSASGNNKTSRPRGVVNARNNDMTDAHRQALQLLQARDEEIDLEVEEIGKGVDVLHEIAREAREEISTQNRMLDTLEAKIDDVHEHVTNVNTKLKTTLDEVRKGDKICMDIFCVLLLLGMIIILYKLSTTAKS